MTAKLCFLFGAARSGTNAITWALESNSEITCFNEDSPTVFNNYLLQSNQNISSIALSTTTKSAFFKSFHDTPRYYEIMRNFPGSRAIYAVRRPDECIRSFVREFGNSGREWVNRWTVAANLGSGFAMQMCGNDKTSIEIARNNSIKVLEMLGDDKENLYDIAAAYYWWQHSFLIEADIISSSAIRIIDYDRLITRPIDIMREVCHWFGIEHQSIGGSIEKITKCAPIPPGRPSDALRATCESLYDNIRVAALASGKYL